MNQKDDVVIVDKVEKTYTEQGVPVRALRGVSVRIKRGAFGVLAGPSGSGKTTLLNLIGGLDSPSAGSIIVDGSDLAQMTKQALADIRLTKIGFVFQAYNLIPVLSALENTEFVMVLQGRDPVERRKRAMEILAEVGLEEYAHRRPNQMSGGQQQRVAVARAVAANPSIILADEPTANLDSKTGESLLRMMLDLNEKKGVTFLFSSHDAMVIEAAKTLVRMKDGEIMGVDEIVPSGDKGEILSRSKAAKQMQQEAST